jgi:hypothetical protein
MELDVLTLRRDRRTAGSAIDASRTNGDVEPSVETRISALGRPVAPVLVEGHLVEHGSIMARPIGPSERKSDTRIDV